jgi:hypothetical protein
LPERKANSLAFRTGIEMKRRLTGANRLSGREAASADRQKGFQFWPHFSKAFYA